MLNKLYTFDEFIMDTENLLAYSACRGIAEDSEPVYDPVIISGPAGCGKTHLLYSVYNAVESRDGEGSALYIDMESYVDSYVLPAVQSGKETDCPKAHVVLIDNAGCIEGKEAVQEEIYRVICRLHEMGKKVIMAMDVPAARLSVLYENMKEGGMDGLVLYEIQSPSRPFKRRFLREMCKSAGVELDNASVNYLADNLGDDLRVLKGCVKMIGFYKRISSADIDVQWLKRNITNDIKGA